MTVIANNNNMVMVYTTTTIPPVITITITIVKQETIGVEMSFPLLFANMICNCVHDTEI